MILANTVTVREETGCLTAGNISYEENVVVKDDACNLGKFSCSSDDRSSGIKYYTETLAKIHEAKLVPKNVLELKLESNGKVQVICKACSKGKKERFIEPGPISKAMSNVKAHLKTPSHLKNVNIYQSNVQKLEAKKMSEESKETSELRFKEVERRFPGGFQLLRFGASSGKCRCKSCNQLIILMPERGCYISNFEAHKKSCGTTPKRKQSSIESFVIPSKKPKTQ